MWSDAKSLESCLTLSYPMVCNPPDSSVQEILQARILEWVAISSSRGSSRPRDRTCICLLHWQAGSLPPAPLGKPSAELSTVGRGGPQLVASGPPALLLSCVPWAPCPALSAAFLVWFSSSSFRVLLTTLHIQHLHASMSRCKVSDSICKAVLGDNLVSCPVGASLNIYALIPSLRVLC